MGYGKIPRIVEYTPASVIYLLKQKDILERLAEQGDTTASDILMDLDSIMKNVKVTARQQSCMDLAWYQGYNYREAAKLLSITPQGVYFNLKLVTNKIAKQLDGRRKNERIRKV